MIDPKELRIGNHVCCEGMEISIDAISKEKIRFKNTKGTFYVDPENLQPIPLTPKILEMCPQLKKWENYNTYELELPNGTIQVTGNELWLGGNDSCTSGMGFTLNIEYLHQFQNLVHDLTHKELEIKELQHA